METYESYHNESYDMCKSGANDTASFCSYFNSNFSVAISTIFLSFIEDCEVNDGSPEKPYANKATQKYFGKRVQKLKQKQKGLSSSKTELREMS